MAWALNVRAVLAVLAAIVFCEVRWTLHGALAPHPSHLVAVEAILWCLVQALLAALVLQAPRRGGGLVPWLATAWLLGSVVLEIAASGMFVAGFAYEPGLALEVAARPLRWLPLLSAELRAADLGFAKLMNAAAALVTVVLFRRFEQRGRVPHVSWTIALLPACFGAALALSEALPERDAGATVAVRVVMDAFAPEPAVARPAPEALGDLPVELRAEGAKPARSVAVIVLESIGHAGAALDGEGPYPRDSAYGAILEPPMPRLARLARRSLSFSRAYTTVPHTTMALVGLLCGYAPPTTLDREALKSLALPGACLPRMLHGLGYATAFFQSAEGTFENRAGLVESLGYASFAGAEHLRAPGFANVNYLGIDDRILVPPVAAWVAGQGSNPYFLTVLNVISHHNYGLPSDVESEALATTKWAARYLAALRFVDGYVETLVAAIIAASPADAPPLFVIVGDHGDALQGPLRRFHDNVMFEETIRVPLLVHDPLAPHGRVVDALTSHLDVAPTLAALLGLRAVPAFQGRNALSLVERARERVLVRCFWTQRCLASVGPRAKLIARPGKGQVARYDLFVDPHETVPEDSAGPSAASEVRAALDEARTIQRAYGLPAAP